jgi:hypothetical protein
MPTDTRLQPTTLAAQHQQTLREQHFDITSPGSLLYDFSVLLDTLQPDGLQASGTYQLLPMKILDQLNEQLACSIDIGLNRPQQKSFPHINGLYLLLRTSGLGQTERRGAKHFLVLSQTALDSWYSLDPTEQYCTLLETWLLRWNGEITGERYSSFQHPLTQWSQFFGRIPATGLQIAGNKDEESFIKDLPGLINIGLLELFGCLSVKDAPAVKGKGWQIATVQKTPWGEALDQLLRPSLQNDFGAFFLAEEDAEPAATIGALQPVLQPYLPAWQNNLLLPEAQFRAGTYIFKVSLGKVWRRIAVRGDMVLDDLSDSILAAYNFGHDHLYCFNYKNRFGATAKVNHPFMEDEPPWTDAVKIGDIGLLPKDQMTYIFDFGDWWEFSLQLEKIDPIDPQLKKPKLLASHGKAPQQYPDVEDWED